MDSEETHVSDPASGVFQVRFCFGSRIDSHDSASWVVLPERSKVLFQRGRTKTSEPAPRLMELLFLDLMMTLLSHQGPSAMWDPTTSPILPMSRPKIEV